VDGELEAQQLVDERVTECVAGDALVIDRLWRLRKCRGRCEAQQEGKKFFHGQY
jgi:hypothetical protein